MLSGISDSGITKSGITERCITAGLMYSLPLPIIHHENGPIYVAVPHGISIVLFFIYNYTGYH